jgi:hypothetical protein
MLEMVEGRLVFTQHVIYPADGHLRLGFKPLEIDLLENG